MEQCRIQVNKYCSINARVGNAAKTSADLRAARCFVVPAGDNHVKWIWAAESRPELRELGRALCASVSFGEIWRRNRGRYGADEQAGHTRLKALE